MFFERSGSQGLNVFQVFGGGAFVAAKCKHCFFELEWRQVEADRLGMGKLVSREVCLVEKTNMTDAVLQADVNYTSHDIHFRLRFLQKSHLAARTVDEALYACMFCIQQGRMPEESDATIFFSQGQLFAHLARHPRPLPVVPGLTVIDAPEIPPPFRNDYDLHFTDPPRASQMVDPAVAREVAALPTARAVETFKKVNNVLRRPPGGAVPLQFAKGQRIVGIEFPPRYNGEWAVGWADGSKAPFPVECVRLDLPARSDVRLQSVSGLKATARWKWAPKDKDGNWLKLEKGETISNISCKSCPDKGALMGSRHCVSLCARGELTMERTRGISGTLGVVRNQLQGENRRVPAVSHGPGFAEGHEHADRRPVKRDEP